MLSPTFLSQATLTAAMVASAIGSFIALSPPNPNREQNAPERDFLSSLRLTGKHVTKVAFAPVGLLSLHASSLAFLFPNAPASLVRHGAENGLNTSLITWSSRTAIPLALILCAGVPLRLVSYSSLGRDFTFALSEPDRLNTSGIYRYVQHPSYMGVFVIACSYLSMLFQLDGVLGCWVPPQWYGALKTVEPAVAIGHISFILYVIATRVRQEEQMLKTKFGAEWERWHAKTARFIPWVI